MKLHWLLLPLLLLLGSCKDKAKQPLPESATAAAEKPQPETSAPKVALPTKATAKQLGSLLRVRVSVGGLPPQDSAAALLHREEIPQAGLGQGKGRFVLALLNGCEEAQLRDPSAKIVVYRNKVGGSGVMATGAHPARLLQFEAASGLALLTYWDTFDYPEDVGFRLERTVPKGADFPVLRTFSVAAPPAKREPWMDDPRFKDNPQYQARMAQKEWMRVPIQPFSSDFGAYRGGSKRAVELPELAPATKADTVHLAVGEPDKLLAFVEAPPGGPVVVTPVDKFAVVVKKPGFKIGSVSFQKTSPGSLELTLEVTPDQGAGSLHLRMSEVAAGAAVKPLSANAAGDFDPIETATVIPLFSRNDKRWITNLNSPRKDGEQVFRLQISWPLLNEWAQLGGGEAASGYGRPFVVRLQHRPDGLHPTVEGIDGPEAAPRPAAAPAAAGVPAAATAPAGAGEATPFPLEAAVRNVALMAGGREVLLELEGAPHWKRFSFEKNDWLPLPGGDLSDMHLAGNLSALFVLDRKAAEVRKYALSDLKLAGTTKLPQAFEAVVILAGGNSDLAPVHVLALKDSLALAPDTLQRRALPLGEIGHKRRTTGWEFRPKERYFVSGDGWSFTGSLDRGGSTSHRLFFYRGDHAGLAEASTNVDLHRRSALTGVSGEYWVQTGLMCAATADGKTVEDQGMARDNAPGVTDKVSKSLAANSPVLFRILAGNREAVPPVPPKVGLFSYFDRAPFAEVSLPELAGVETPADWADERWTFFDPYSLRLGTLAKDRKTWFVRKLTAPEQRDQPVLLNWPDTTFARGAEFRFQPLLLGGKKFTAEVYGRPGLATVNEADGTVRVAIPANEVATLLLLTLKVPGKDGSELAYAIPLHSAGPEPMLAAPIGAERKGIGDIGKAFAQLNRPTSTCRALLSASYHFAEPIEDMQGPVSGCLALVNQRQVEFFSLATRQVVGFIAMAPAAFYYAGAGALFEYDRQKRTLTRISVPDGRRGAVLNFSATMSLAGIGMGTEPASPLTLVVSVRESAAPIVPGGKRSQLAAEPIRLGDQTFKSGLTGMIMTIRNSQTLQSAGMAQPVELPSMFGAFGNTEPIMGQTDRLRGYFNRPVTLPASQNGIIVNLPHHLLAISPAQVFFCPFGEQDREALVFSAGWGLPGGSISGLMATSPTKGVFKGGWPVRRADQGTSNAPSELGGTLCGRYRLLRATGGNWEDACLEIRASENSAPLMLVARLPHLYQPRRIVGLGNDGPLAMLDEKGQWLQILDFNIPAVMKELAPDDFHVTSQPRPCVVPGSVLQYQVEVNNPAAVQTYRLQSAVPGAQLSPQGLLQYTPPANGAEGKKTSISIEVVGKNGQVFLHEFPIYILPTRPPATPPPRAPVGSRAI